MYSIGDVAAIMGVATSTLRYYDKEGLLPFVNRDSGGRRRFSQDDLNYIEVINCLRGAGVPVKDVAEFIRLCMEGDSTLAERLEYIDAEIDRFEKRIAEGQDRLDFLRYKQWYYRTALSAGTESIHFLPGTRSIDPGERDRYRAQIGSSGDSRE